MEAHGAVEKSRLQIDNDLESCVQNLQLDLDHAEFNNIQLIIKLREVADDLEIIWTRCRYARFGTSSLKTASGVVSAVGGACILMSTGPIMPLVTLGSAGLVLGSVGSYGLAKLEQYLSSKKFAELSELMDLNADLLKRINDSVNQICSLDYQTLDALLRTADRLIDRDHALFPFFQTVRNLMNRVQMEPLTEVSSLFGFLGQIDALGSRALSTTVPIELASLKGDAQEGSGNAARKGFQRFGGILLILTGVISAYTSSQELVELIRTNKSEAAELLKAKANEIERNKGLFDFLRD